MGKERDVILRIPRQIWSWKEVNMVKIDLLIEKKEEKTRRKISIQR